MNRLVISGARTGHPDVWRWMERHGRTSGRPELTILGDANGVDAQAYAFCVTHRWSFAVNFAYWEELGRAVAGPERNGRMVQLAGPRDVFLGFPGPESSGTYDCAALANAAGLRCYMAKVKANDRRPMVHPLRAAA